MATVARENIGLLNDKITVTVSKEDYFPTFEKKLKEHSKKVNMPGFRKGMVPVGMIKKMYGPSIYTDEILKTVEKELRTYLETEKPDIFAQPLALDADIRMLDLNKPADYEFGFEIGLKPSFKIAPLNKANVTFNKVKVTDEMVEEEVGNMLNKSGKMTAPETIESDEAVLNVKLTECDTEGNAIANGLTEIETSLVVKYLTPDTQQLFMGKKMEDAVVIELSKAFTKDKLGAFAKDLGLNTEDAADLEKHFKITILKIGLLEKGVMDEEFFAKVFPEVTIESEEEFRQKLKEEIEQYWDGQSRIQLHDQLFHYMVNETNIEFPAGFLKRWLQNGSEERKTPEQAEEEFPVFSSQLKWTLISDQLIKDNHLVVTKEEVKATMKIEVMRYFGNTGLGGDNIGWLDSYVDTMIKDEKQLDATYRRLIMDKLFSYAESKASPVEKEVTAEELTGMQHHH